VALRFTAAVTAFLGGAAVHRCDICFVLNSALAAEGAALDQELLFPQVVKR
jgi:CBS-domain-containing membrane protein